GHSSGGSWSWPQRCQSIHDTDLPSAGRTNGNTACKVLRVSIARSSRSSGQKTSTVTSSPDTVTCDSSCSMVPSRRWKAIPSRTCIWSATHWAMPIPGKNRRCARNRIATATPSVESDGQIARINREVVASSDSNRRRKLANRQAVPVRGGVPDREVTVRFGRRHIRPGDRSRVHDRVRPRSEIHSLTGVLAGHVRSAVLARRTRVQLHIVIGRGRVRRLPESVIQQLLFKKIGEAHLSNPPNSVNKTEAGPQRDPASTTERSEPRIRQCALSPARSPWGRPTRSARPHRRRTRWP